MTERGRAPARAPAAAARRRPFFLTMKLTPMKAEEATARSAPVRLAAKRSPAAAFGGAGVIDGVQRRRREAGAFGAGPGADLEMEVGICFFFLDFSCLKFVLIHLENMVVCEAGRRRERGRDESGQVSSVCSWRWRFKVIKEWKGFACYDSFTSLLGVHMMRTRL